MPPERESQVSLDDLNVRVELHAVERPPQVGGRNSRNGAGFVRVDVGVEGLAVDGVDFTAGDFLELISKDRAAISFHRQSWVGPNAPPNSWRGSWIPRGGRREFSLFWDVKPEHLPVRLRVNGVRHYRAIPMFPAEEARAEDFPDPETDLTISEQGIPVLNPNGVKEGIEGVGLTPEQVNTAIERGRDFLWEEFRIQIGRWGKVRTRGENYPAMLALVHCDAHLTYPEFDRELRRFITESKVPANSVYENALLAMIIESYGDSAFLPKLEQVAHYLVEAQGRGAPGRTRPRHPPGFTPMRRWRRRRNRRCWR